MTIPSVLIVDQDVTTLETLKEVIRIRLPGVDVRICDSASCALQELRGREYDVVVSNVRLPDMDGFELLRAIHAVRPDVLTLLIGGYADYNTAVEALRARAFDLIRKPIEPAYFATVLASALQMRRVDRLKNSLQHEPDLSEVQVTLQGIDVLLVEDDDDTRDFLSTVLRNYGAQVTAVTSVGEALRAIDRVQPQVLVSDLRMPFEDGYSLIRKLRRRSQDQGGRLPALAVTAHSEEQRRAALEVGFQQYLAKPVDPEIFALVVRSLALPQP